MLMLAGIVVLHITTIVLLLVATIDNVSGWPIIFFYFPISYTPVLRGRTEHWFHMN